MTKIEILKTDITKVQVDIIINAANTSLLVLEKVKKKSNFELL